MNVASLELTKQLYELSHWWEHHVDTETGTTFPHETRSTPQYTLGYLLRKLPARDTTHGAILRLQKYDKLGEDYYELAYGTFGATYRADTPEDAACQLAIELFKQGVLKREDA